MLVKCSSDRGTGRRDASRKLPTSTDQAARLCYRAGDRLSIAAVVDGASRRDVCAGISRRLSTGQ